MPGLHFEACYYQAIEFAIERGIALVEGGAQGEHKHARGFLPEKTRSFHWLAHPAFARAVDDYLAREGAGVSDYVDELNERSPFSKIRRVDARARRACSYFQASENSFQCAAFCSARNDRNSAVSFSCSAADNAPRIRWNRR